MLPMASPTVFALMNGCNVFPNRRCSSVRERVLSLWEGMSHESCQKWKCSFQQMQLSLIVLLKCPTAPSPWYLPILHLEGCAISLKAVLMLLVAIKISKRRMKKGVRKGCFSFVISSYIELPNPYFWRLPTHLYGCHLWIYKIVDQFLLWVSVSEEKAFKIRQEDCRNINNMETWIVAWQNGMFFKLL